MQKTWRSTANVCMPDYSGWWHLLPQRTANPPLTTRTQADVVIIGAGFAGLAAAHRLQQLQPSLRVVVLEAQAVGQGASGRNSGFIIDLPHDVAAGDYGQSGAAQQQRSLRVNRAATGFALAMAAANNWDDNVLARAGSYNIAVSPQGEAHIASYARLLQQLDEPHRVLTATEIQAVTGSPAFTAAIYTPGTLMIQPVAYMRGVADALPSAVRLFEHSPVHALTRNEHGWQVMSRHGEVHAARVILANNGHARSFGFFRQRLMHVYTYASLTEPFAPERLAGQRRWAATPAFPMGTTVRRIEGVAGDRILIRSRYTIQAKPGMHRRAVERAGRQHDRKFVHRFPQLADVPMAYRWGGPMALTWNGVPAFGEVEKDLYAAVACNGIGATKATAAGIAIAEYMLGESTLLQDAFASYAKPARLPLAPLLYVGAKATLRWREYRAGSE